MSLLKNGPTRIAFGFGLGVMTAELFKELMPVFRDLRQPLLKAAVQSGEILARIGLVKLAEFRETLADVRAEIQSERAQAPSPGPFNETPVTCEKQSTGIM